MTENSQGRAVPLTVEMITENYFTEPGSFVGRFELKCSEASTIWEVEQMGARSAIAEAQRWMTGRDPGESVPLQLEMWSTGFKIRGEVLYYFPWQIDIIGNDGDILFARDIHSVELREVWAASAAGLLGVQIERDALAFVARRGGANGPEFAGEFLQSWPAFRYVLGALVIEVVGAILHDKIRVLTTVLGKRWKQYRARNATPEDVLNQLLRHHTWSLEEFCIRFRTSQNDARALLDVFGYGPSESEPGVYVNPSINTEARLEAYKQHLVEGTPGSLFYNVGYPLWEHPLIQAINELAEDLPRDDAG